MFTGKQMRKNVRPAEAVKPIALRMGRKYVAELDRLCAVNKRSRREIIEILINEAAAELKLDPEARINP